MRSIRSGYLADVAEGCVDCVNARTGADGSATPNARNHAVGALLGGKGMADATECPGDRFFA